MAILGYIWRVFYGCLAFAVMWGLLLGAQGRFQITVIAGLGVIFATIRAFMIGTSMTLMQYGQALDGVFNKLREDMGLHPVEYTEQENARTNRLWWNNAIDGTFVAILYLFCLFQIVLVAI